MAQCQWNSFSVLLCTFSLILLCDEQCVQKLQRLAFAFTDVECFSSSLALQFFTFICYFSIGKIAYKKH